MDFLVRVKQGHPTGVRRRSGLTVTREGLRLSEDQFTDEMLKDSWLEWLPVHTVPPTDKTVPLTGGGSLSDEERARLKQFADNRHRAAMAEAQAASAAAVTAQGGAVGEQGADQEATSETDVKQAAATDEAGSETRAGDSPRGRKRKAP